MPEGLLVIVGVLALGFILLFLEIFVPGGVLGILGGLLMIYACYLAFGLSPAWGGAAVGLSVVVAALAIRLVASSRIGKKLVLDDAGARDWKAAEKGLEDLLGSEGRTLTQLRPAGQAEIGDQRVDVVADDEFIPAGVRVRVVEVEGNRVVVEALAAAEVAAEDESSTDEPPTDGGSDSLE